jgi:UDP-sugar transporter A1/2/3
MILCALFDVILYVMLIQRLLIVFYAVVQAADNLEGPVVAVLGQLKIVTTALFSVTLLKRTLTLKQWVALFALVSK